MCLQHVLFDTVVGDVLCRGLERLTGCALVPLSNLEYEVRATEKGITEGKRHERDGP